MVASKTWWGQLRADLLAGGQRVRAGHFDDRVMFLKNIYGIDLKKFKALAGADAIAIAQRFARAIALRVAPVEETLEYFLRGLERDWRIRTKNVSFNDT